MPDLRIHRERYRVRGHFTISRGRRTHAEVIVVTLREGTTQGRGECLPYARYGESLQSVLVQLEALRKPLARGLDRQALQEVLPPGAARNAVDCAFWDLEAKVAGSRVWELLGRPKPRPVLTAYTLSIEKAEEMGLAAAAASERPLLKLKLGGSDDLARVKSVRLHAPRARLIVDANEAWTLDTYRNLAPQLARLGVELVEQPLAQQEDAELIGVDRHLQICADESFRGRDDLEKLQGIYDFVNVKLDKTGGLTEALALVGEARARGFQIMVGSMLATSLSIAPALLLVEEGDLVDLDGPLLLAQDRSPALRYEGSLVHPPDAKLWG